MPINKQIPVKQVVSDGTSLLVHSIFYTIQGEGIFAGRPAVFIRLAGCNLQCPACDTEYTANAKEMYVWDIEALVRHKALNTNTLVVITGGEPFRQSLGKLIDNLTNLFGYDVQIETNGTLFDDSINYANKKLFIMCSPKTGSINKKLAPHITAYKYVGGCDERDIPYGSLMDNLDPHGLENHSLALDGLPRQALGHSAAPILARPPADFKGKIFLQPIDRQDPELNKFHQQAVVEACMQHGYTLCLQMHKIIEVE